MKTYLAGGMKTDWRSRISTRDGLGTFIDPTTHNLIDETEYTPWDIQGVKSSDVIFCYIEKDNLGASGAMVEMGYGSALGKVIILVEEPGNPTTSRFGMARVLANFYTQDFESGVEYLKTVLPLF